MEKKFPVTVDWQKASIFSADSRIERFNLNVESMVVGLIVEDQRFLNFASDLDDAATKSLANWETWEFHQDLRWEAMLSMRHYDDFG